MNSGRVRTGPGSRDTEPEGVSAASGFDPSRGAYCECQNCETARRERAMRIAYGFLWHMEIDRRDDNLRLASNARRALNNVLSPDERADGIARVKGADARFTGAS